MLFGRKKKEAVPLEGGLILFEKVEDALQAEKILASNGYEIKLVAPPPALRKGCDLALRINLVECMGIERLLGRKSISYVDIVPTGGEGELLSVVRISDFGKHIMVKAGNMKLTFSKSSGMIVNSSGGGCPDIPYLYSQMVGRKLTEVKRPKEQGFTLCALMLDRAYIECMNIWKRLEQKTT